MGDNITVTPGAGSIISTDELTINGAIVQVQRTKTVVGKDGVYTGDVAGRNIDGDANASAMFVDQRALVSRIQTNSAGLTIATTAYVSGDQLGTIFTFASAVRATGGTGYLTGVILNDKSNIIGAVDLVLFRESVTLAADNAAFAVSDADMDKAIGIISLPSATNLVNNRLTCAFDFKLPFDCVGTSLFLALITRSGHTFFGAATDLVITLFVEQN